MTRERDRLRATFDGAALLYDEVRPGYPDLFDNSFGGSIVKGYLTTLYVARRR